jgi:hypothetical protein
MSETARLCCRARSRWPMLALLVLLAPTVRGAAPPVEVSTSNASPHMYARSGKIRIGRIFFSPAERRHRYADKKPVTDAPSTAHTTRGDRLQINGAISSSTQGRAVWVNGAVIESSKFKSAWTDPAGSVWLRNDKHMPRPLQPGQAINPANGAVEDLLPAGSVARH